MEEGVACGTPTACLWSKQGEQTLSILGCLGLISLLHKVLVQIGIINLLFNITICLHSSLLEWRSFSPQIPRLPGE